LPEVTAATVARVLRAFAALHYRAAVEGGGPPWAESAVMEAFIASTEEATCEAIADNANAGTCATFAPPENASPRAERHAAELLLVLGESAEENERFIAAAHDAEAVRAFVDRAREAARDAVVRRLASAQGWARRIPVRLAADLPVAYVAHPAEGVFVSPEATAADVAAGLALVLRGAGFAAVETRDLHSALMPIAESALRSARRAAGRRKKARRS
jgi:hypothetical protein